MESREEFVRVAGTEILSGRFRDVILHEDLHPARRFHDAVAAADLVVRQLDVPVVLADATCAVKQPVQDSRTMLHQELVGEGLVRVLNVFVEEDRNQTVLELVSTPVVLEAHFVVGHDDEAVEPVMIEFFIAVLLRGREEVAANGLLDELNACRLAECFTDRLGSRQQGLRRERRERVVRSERAEIQIERAIQRHDSGEELHEKTLAAAAFTLEQHELARAVFREEGRAHVFLNHAAVILVRQNLRQFLLEELGFRLGIVDCTQSGEDHVFLGVFPEIEVLLLCIPAEYTVLKRNHIRVQLRQSVTTVTINRHHAEDFIDIARIHQFISRLDRSLRLRIAVILNLVFEKIANAGLDDAPARRCPAFFGPLEPTIGSEEDQTVLLRDLRCEVARVDFEATLSFDTESMALIHNDISIAVHVVLFHVVTFVVNGFGLHGVILHGEVRAVSVHDIFLHTEFSRVGIVVHGVILHGTGRVVLVNHAAPPLIML